MARAIYEIKLKELYFPAASESDAIEMLKAKDITLFFGGEGIEVFTAATEEHTMRLFILAKTMYDTDKFNCAEIESAVKAVAYTMGYFDSVEEIAKCVLEWVEKFDEMTLSELEEWIIA